MAWYDPTSWNWTGGEAGNSIKGPEHFDLATGQLGQIAQGAQNRQAAQMQGVQLGPAAQLNPLQMNQTRGGALDVANRLGSIATGQAPGAGELAVNRQIGSAVAAQQSAARAARGANAALAYRNAARNTADIGFAGAGQAAQAQMQDQANANAQLGQLYSGLYGQDIGAASQNAQLQQANQFQGANLAQQAQIENLRAQMQQRGMNDAQQIAAFGQMLGWDQARIQSEIAKSQLNAQDKGLLGTLMQVGGQIGVAMAGK